MTRNQAIRRHRILWRWLAENPKEDKKDWPGWKENGGKYPGAVNNCFLCEAPTDPTSGHCCPVVWPEGGTCMSRDSLYPKWQYARGKRRAPFAKQIAELPVHRLPSKRRPQ